MTAPAADATEHALAARAPEAAMRNLPRINASTGLSTDYLNHFTEAVMLLEMSTTMPDCLEDLRAWRPKTYVEHFARSNFADRDGVIAAYEAANPAIRDALDSTAQTLNNVLVEVRNVVLGHIGTPDGEALAQRAVAWLKPLIARAAAITNGTRTGHDGDGTQAAIDARFDR